MNDAQGLAIPEATVTLRNQATSATQSATTSSRGSYEFTYLNPGLYTIEVSKQGFKDAIVTNIKLDTSTEYSVAPVVLQVGSVTEKVTVQEDANVARTVGAEIAGTIENSQIANLPILDRNPMQLLGLQAGINQARRNASAGYFVSVIDGQRQSFSNLTLDGINIQDNFLRSESLDYTPNWLFMSQVSEFTITNQNAGPQMGLGASQVSIVTPSGTNNWHGDGFWFYRSGAWAANEWFNDANGVAKPNLLLNQAGGDIGGPIRKDKLFFYAAYELYRMRHQQPTDTTVLSPSARSGIFQWRATCTTNCPSGVTPGSIQSMNVLSAMNVAADPTIAGLLAQVPTTMNNPGIGDGLNTGGYSFNQRDNDSHDNVTARLDWSASEHNSFSGTYAWNNFFSDRPGSSLGLTNTYSAIPAVSNNDNNNFLSAAWRWTPTANFTNEVRFGFNLSPVNFLTTQQFGAPYPYTVSGTIFNNPDQNEFPSSRNVHTWSWQDNASWSHGNHLLNFGMQVQRVTIFAQDYNGTVPNLNLDYTQSSNPELSGSQFSGGISSNDLNTANQLLASLGGLVGSELQTFNVTSTTSGYVPAAPLTQDYRYDNWSLYFGDSWKLRRTLTLTYGLRWEYNSPFNEQNGLLQFPVVPAGQTIQQTMLSDATLAYFGGNTGKSVYQKHFRDFAPNIGIAWDPFGDGKTSIRAGYSINYVNDELIGAPYNANLSSPGISTQAGKQFLSGITTSSSGSALAVSTPILSNTFSGNWANLYNYDTGLSFGYGIDPNLSTPYVQQWNLSVQREIGWNSSITVSYVGNRALKLYRAIDLNQVQINSNGFLQAFNVARQNGFASLAQTGNFNVCYTGPNTSPDCSTNNPNVAYFAGNFYPGYDGLLDYPGYSSLIGQYFQQGKVGDLADLYHSIAADAAAFGAPVALAPNQYLRAADLLGNYSYSGYNAGSVEFQRRFRSGLNLQASYTFSKVLTDYSADTPAGSQRFYPYLDNANPALEKARANFDLTHAFKANFVYDLPIGSGHAWSPSSKFLNDVLSGWTTASIFTWQSGAPFSILSGIGSLNRAGRSVLTNTASTTSTPQQIASQLGVYHSNGDVLLINPQYIGPDGRGVPDYGLTCTPIVAGGFCNPQPGNVGTLARNAFNGPTFFNWDFSILKSVPVAESKELKLRLDMFNAPNHPTFAVGDPNYASSQPGAGPSDMYINDPKFGVATSTVSTPRVLQVGLEFVF